MINKILVPLDGSDLAEKAIPYALEMAQKFDATIVLVRVLHPHLVMSDYGAGLYHELVALEKNEAKSYLDTLCLKLQKSHPYVERKILAGGLVAQAIIDLAQEISADVIVMSTHGRSGLGRWVYGSVATKVLQHAKCPVLIVRPQAIDDEPLKANERQTQSNGQ